MAEYSSLMYEIEVDIDGYKTNDVSEFSVFRCPFEKTSSFTILTVNMQTIMFMGIETECKAHNFPSINITIKQNDKSLYEPDTYGEVKEIATKNYLILNIEGDEKPNLAEPYTSVTLYLANPVLYYLNTTNSYNKIIEDKTGLETLKDFEQHLTSIYGCKTFEFTKIGDNINLNSYKYEQILIRLKNDLLIPTWIIQNYKPFDSFSFYFFDDFCITDQNSKDIIGYLINLIDKDQFSKMDCLDLPTEVFAGLKYISSNILNDTFNYLIQENASKIFVHQMYNLNIKKQMIKIQFQILKLKIILKI